MRVIEHIRLALRALAVNKLRSVLTMLGIIIGVGAVITLLSAGQGVQRYVTGQLQSIGTNILFVVPSNLTTSQMQRGRNIDLTLSLADAEAIADPLNIPDMAQVAPEIMGSADVAYGKTTLSLSVSGVTPAYEDVRNFPVDYGTFVTDLDNVGGARVAVLGSSVAQRLYGSDVYPIGTTIKIKNVPFKVVGVLKSKGGTGGPSGNQDETVLVPLNTAHERLFPRYHNSRGQPLVTVIYVQVASEDRMEAAGAAITDLLRERHNIQYRDDDDFSVINQKDLLAIFGQITSVLTIFLGAIAGISLLVGGIGIMNIMLVSVTERTREIGLRKAVGAKRRDILTQFLIESVILALVGGSIGIMLGVLGTTLISYLQTSFKPVVTAQSVILATGFSAAVGLFFGIYPATRAARLNPIDALRYE